MKLHGNTGHAVTDLAGNIVKAERGFRIDPATFLYLPLRIVIAEGLAGNGEISFDHPADLFAVYGNPELDPVGSESRNPLRSIDRSGARSATELVRGLAPIAKAAPSRSRPRAMRQTDAGRQPFPTSDK